MVNSIKVHTQDPIKDLWIYLRRFENSAWLSKKFPSVSEQKQSEIIYCIKQAREYYGAAKESDTSVKPLLLFYGMLDLVRATLLIKNSEFTLKIIEEKERKGHGLKFEIEDKQNFKLGKLRVLGPGLIREFTRLLNPAQEAEFSEKEIYMLELILRIPLPSYNIDIVEMYNFFPLCLHKRELIDNKIKIKNNFKKPLYVMKNFKEYIEEIFSANDISYFFELSSIDENEIILTKKEEANLEIFKILDLYRDEWYILPKGTLIMDQTILHFYIMYVLSILSRYKPEKWKEVLDSEGIEENIIFIEPFINYSERYFPNLILNLLMEGDFVFFSPTIL